MFSNTSSSGDPAPKWLHPNDVLKIQRLKLKKKQLQARINKSNLHSQECAATEHLTHPSLSAAIKRRNPFVKDTENKRPKLNNSEYEESADQTLFKLLHFNDSDNSVNAVNQPTSFTNVLEKSKKTEPIECINQSTSFTNVLVNIEKAEKTVPIECLNVGKSWIPIDWALKSKVRLMSSKPFVWNQKLKISEEASGITGFVRCLDNSSNTTLDTSPNAKFHQCCLFWQQPSLPWLSLFPRSLGRTSARTSIASTAAIRESLQAAYADSLRSLFQLVRTRQCPYFYICTNTFTVLFRAAGICGYSEMNAIVTPTTRGFRHLLKQEDIEYSMPLKRRRTSDQGYETLDSTGDTEANLEDEPPDEQWLESMGINAEDIKQINYTQAKIAHKMECEGDNSEESLVLIEGVEVHALYNFLLNCKSCTSVTGPLAGIPPTLLAPIAFSGATLCALKVRESKVRVDDLNYFSLEISGPILPHVIHDLCVIHPSDQSLTATFANFTPTTPFSKIKASDQSEKENKDASGFCVFGQENLSDCGLNPTILKHFCSSNLEYITNIESLKYDPDNKTYTWL